MTRVRIRYEVDLGEQYTNVATFDEWHDDKDDWVIAYNEDNRGAGVCDKTYILKERVVRIDEV